MQCCFVSRPQIGFVVYACEQTQDHIQNKIVTEAMSVSMVKFSPKYFIRGLHDNSKRQKGKNMTEPVWLLPATAL